MLPCKKSFQTSVSPLLPKSHNLTTGLYHPSLRRFCRQSHLNQVVSYIPCTVSILGRTVSKYRYNTPRDRATKLVSTMHSSLVSPDINTTCFDTRGWGIRERNKRTEKARAKRIKARGDTEEERNRTQPKAWYSTV